MNLLSISNELVIWSVLIIALFMILAFLALAGLAALLRYYLDLVDKLRAIAYQAGMDAVAVWLSASSSRLDIEERREKLALARSYARLRLQGERVKLLEKEASR